MRKFFYGMRLRGFSIGTQPSRGLIGPVNKEVIRKLYNVEREYHDILEYSMQLYDSECEDYDLDYIGAMMS